MEKWTRLFGHAVTSRREERQRRWPEALFRRLATLPLSDFVPYIQIRPLKLRDNIRHQRCQGVNIYTNAFYPPTPILKSSDPDPV